VIPFIDLHPLAALVKHQVLPRWAMTLESCEFVAGPAVRQVEQQLCTQLQVPHAIACGSGTDALILALQAAGVKAGDHVAVPNLTFWATFEAVVQLGAIPVLIDFDPADLQMCLSEFKAAFETFRFRVAVLVHLFGWASGCTRDFRSYCREHEITLVEDGAQCYGVMLGGEPLLHGALLGTLSFYPAKVLGGCMDGGAVTAQSADHAERIRSLANHGRSAHYSHNHVGWNSRMSATAAIYLDELLPHANAIVANRRASAHRYQEAAQRWKGVQCFAPPADIAENGYLCVLDCQAHSAQRLAATFAEQGVATRRTYPETMADQKAAAGRFVAVTDLSRSRSFVNRVLNLPLYYGLPGDQQTSIIAAAQTIFA
jgi:UDP-2-acetamido-2-deoxy-ribo-hexuluronate aminotransferase